MGVLTVLEIISGYAQNTGIISSVNITYPDSLLWVQQRLRVLRADFTQLPDLPALDFRAQHILLTNALPLALAILLLILFKSVRVVLWYCSLLCSVGVAFSGLVLKFMPVGQISEESNIALIMIVLGFMCIFLSFLGFFLWRRIREKVHPVEREYTKPFWIQARNFFVGSLLLFLGLVASNAFEMTLLAENLYYYSSFRNAVTVVGPIVGWIMVAGGISLLYNWFSGLFKATRQLNTRINYYFRKNAVKILLVVLGVLYVPMTTSVISSFMCTEQKCPLKYEFIQDQTTLDWRSIENKFLKSIYQGIPYRSCAFKNCNIQNELCPEVTEFRLITDLSLSCTNEMFFYYFPGSILSVFSITFGIPILFYRLISESVAIISQIPTNKHLHDDLKWAVQCKATSSSCRSLYTMFEKRWRYYKLINLIHKLMVVSVFVFVQKNSFPLLCIVTGLHTIVAFMSAYFRPYVHNYEDFLATLCLFVNAINAVVSILIAISISLPDWISPTLIALNTVLPTAAIILGFYLDYKDGKREEQKQKEREEQDVKNATENIRTDPEIKNEHLLTQEALFKLKRDEERRVRRLSKQQKQDVNNIIDALDQQLDSKLVHILVNYFLFLGVVAFLAIGISVLGLLRSSLSANHIGPSLSYFGSGSKIPTGTKLNITQIEYAGYNNWEEFTQNCCCNHTLITQNGIVTEDRPLIVETWKCRAPSSLQHMPLLYKQRARRYDGYDGQKLRGYCSKTFTNSQPQMDPISNRIKVGGNDFAAYNLW